MQKLNVFLEYAIVLMQVFWVLPEMFSFEITMALVFIKHSVASFGLHLVWKHHFIIKSAFVLFSLFISKVVLSGSFFFLIIVQALVLKLLGKTWFYGSSTGG